MGRKILIRNTQSPGDVVVLSAMIRDLHRCHPGLFETAVSTAPGAEHVFYENPDIAAIASRRVPVKQYKQFVAHYPLVKQCNQQRKHFLWGFIEDINRRMHLSVKLTEFRPHILLSQAEMQQRPYPDPYWVFLSGGKTDFKTKIWSQANWQEVIDRTADRIKWVQCGGGSRNHIRHIPKEGILADMVAKTTLREFIKLIYHSEGVVSVVTAAMHIAAAFNKPCVVIAGGREPWWWEGYTHENRLVNMRFGDPTWQPPANDNYVGHKFLHTIGQLTCCQSFGCWKKKVDEGRDRCKKPVSYGGEMIPKCKQMITPDMVVEAIDDYYRDGVIGAGGLAVSVVGALDNMTYCAYAPRGTPAGWLDKMKLELPDALIFDSATARHHALTLACAEGRDWVVWLEPGVELRANWQTALRFRLTKPGVIGRMHRGADGQLYPYPAFFAAHREVLTPSGSFTASFKGVAPKQCSRLGSYIELPTEPREIT